MNNYLLSPPPDKDLSVKKNNATLFVGIIDGHSYLLDINDQGSFHPKGSHYLVVCSEDGIKVSLNCIGMCVLCII